MACTSAGTMFIMEAGIKLCLSEECTATACVFFHKFYSSMNKDDYNSSLVVMASLNLAAKVKEMPVKLSDIVNTCHRCLHPNEPVLEVTDRYWHLKDSVARYELLLLRVLRFDVNIAMPHPYLLHYLLALSRWIDFTAWQKSHLPSIAFSLLQDSFLTTLPLSLPPHTLATAALYLAVLCCRLEVPGSHRQAERQWWEVFSPGSSETELQEIARKMMAVYSDGGRGGLLDKEGGGRVEGRGRESRGGVEGEGGEREGKVGGGGGEREESVDGGRDRGGKVEGGGRESRRMVGLGRERRGVKGAGRMEVSAAGAGGEGVGVRQRRRKSEAAGKSCDDNQLTKRPKQKSF